MKKCYFLLLLPILALRASLHDENNQCLQNSQLTQWPDQFLNKILTNYHRYLDTLPLFFSINPETFKNTLITCRTNNHELLFGPKENKFTCDGFKEFKSHYPDYPETESLEIIYKYIRFRMYSTNEKLNKKILLLFRPITPSFFLMNSCFPSENARDPYLYPIIFFDPFQWDNKSIAENLNRLNPEICNFIDYSVRVEMTKIALGFSLDLTICKLLLAGLNAYDQETWEKWSTVMQFMHTIIAEIYPGIFCKERALYNLASNIHIIYTPLLAPEVLIGAIPAENLEILAHSLHVCQHVWHIENIEQLLIDYYHFDQGFIEILFGQIRGHKTFTFPLVFL
jgi:hypothetical protein